MNATSGMDIKKDVILPLWNQNYQTVVLQIIEAGWIESTSIFLCYLGI